MPISVQVLDTVHGRPASGVALRLERSNGRDSVVVDTAVTDESGRVGAADWEDPGAGSFRLVVDARRFYALLGLNNAHGELTISFDVRTAALEQHIPILLAPFGYSTYIGSTI